MQRIKIAAILAAGMLLGSMSYAQVKKPVAKGAPKKAVATKLVTKGKPAVANVKPDFNSNSLIPLESNIKSGTLPNGMKYFIKKNGYPANRVEMMMALQVGSIMEDDDQQGLAHFTEHMAFNGTKNFKKGALVNYLEKSGMKFGADLNAYTSFDETVYMLELPTDDQQFITNGLTILMDWSHNVSFEDAEIDKERGVVIEEWRLGKGAEDRMFNKLFPIQYYNSKYANRLPIGKKEILENFKYDVVKRFYKDWYRPELEAIIVVGDIDVAKIEKEIKSLFSSIPASSGNVRKRDVVPVPSYAGTKFGIAADKEASYNVIQVAFKQPKTLVGGSYKEYKAKSLDNLASSCFQERLSALAKDPNSPLLFAGAQKGSYMGDKDAFQVYAVAKPGKTLETAELIGSELKKLAQYGVTAGEIERVKQATLSTYENMVNQKNTAESKTYAQELVRHFINKESAPGISKELELQRELMPSFTADMANSVIRSWIKMDDVNVVAMLQEVEGQKAMSEEELKSAWMKGMNANVTANTDEKIPTELMVLKPTAGTIVSEKSLGNGITEWSLSNGARVLYKPTDFKQDEIMFSAWSKGGQSLEDPSNDVYTRTAADLVNSSGLAEFNSNTLEKMMAGKSCNIVPDINNYGEGLYGSSNNKDFEWMMQMLHLYITKPRIDDNGVNLVKSQMLAALVQKTASPEGWFYDSVSKILVQNNPRIIDLTEAQINKIDGQKSLEIYKRRMQNPADFSYMIIGDVNKDKLKSMVCQYIASIPMAGSKESFKDMNETKPKGKISWVGKKGTEPKSTVSLMWSNEISYPDMKGRLELDATMRILSIMLRENLREEQGGVYGVGASQFIQREPKTSYTLRIGFGCSPDNKNKLVDATMSEINKLRTDGPSQGNLDKIKETLKREREVNAKKNQFWNAIIRQTQDYSGETLDSRLNDYLKTVDAITPASIKATADRYFNTPNSQEFILMPEK